MHYGKYTFNKNGRPTIEVIGNPYKVIGQRYGFSKTDIEQLNALYDCSNDGELLSMFFVHIHDVISNICSQLQNPRFLKNPRWRPCWV